MRRYSDFELLREYFTKNLKYLGILLPKLPEKHKNSDKIKKIFCIDHSFLEKRKLDLQKFLNNINENEQLNEDEFFLQFLSLDDLEFELEKKKKNNSSLIIDIYSKFTNIKNSIYIKYTINKKEYGSEEIEKLINTIKKRENNFIKLQNLLNCCANSLLVFY